VIELVWSDRPLLFHRLAEYLERSSAAIRFPIKGHGVVLIITGVPFYLQERNRIAEFDMTWPYDTTECQQVDRLPPLSGPFKKHPQFAYHYMVASMRIARVTCTQSV
jgi:hypothetical protein